MKKSIVLSAVLAGALAVMAPMPAFALGGAVGAKQVYATQGKIGGIHMDPYGISPLTAIITNGGFDLSDVTVTIKPKPGGQPLTYKVGPQTLKTYGGIPLAGLYAAHVNEVEVSYTKSLGGKNTEKITETYKVPTQGYYAIPSERLPDNTKPFKTVEVQKLDKEFADRMYFINNITGQLTGRSSRFVWDNPSGGAAEWNFTSNAFVVDTQGEIRWYLNTMKFLDFNDMFRTGIMMGFKQNPDGAMTWGFGQRYVKYDFMGRQIFDRQLPLGYQDFSHSMDTMENGNYLLRVASANQKRADGKNVRTVRDVIVEVDPEGRVVDEWKLYDILDPYRSDVVKVLDQGAVCLNIDESAAGKTMSAEELAAMDASDHFGDVAGTGIGRNWAHVNSVDHDPSDDSIIISSRHQNAVIKIGRDKKVKWILGGHKGWKEQFKSVLLQPVDKNGKKIECDDDMTKCPGYTNDEGGFDWTYTQHTAFRIDSKSKKGEIMVSVFDNGDSRGFEQPAIASMKYSRAVIYKINEKKKTVEQVWEYGKARGAEWFSPVTSITEYQMDKNSVSVYSATAGMQYDLAAGRALGAPKPEINEFKWGATEPSVQIKFTGTGSGYQAFPVDFQKAFEK